MGRIIDKMIPWASAFIATFLIVLCQCILVGGAGINIAAVIIACFGTRWPLYYKR
jgi:hypothetical protein